MKNIRLPEYQIEMARYQRIRKISDNLNSEISF